MEQNNKVELLNKIHYYKEEKWCITFRELVHTIDTFIDIMKPLNVSFNKLSYFDFFFKNIDFDKIESIGSSEPTNKEIKKYCNSIYYGLEQIFRSDINKAILNFQNNISKLSTNEAVKIQKELISVIGNLKRQTRQNKEGISFTERYNLLYKNIENRERLLSIDYQMIITHFNETLSNDLLSTYEIINETLLNTIPLNKSTETTNHFDNNLPLKNYELFFVHYKNFFINIEINDIKEFYNTCNDLKEVEIADISYRAKQEVEKLLNTPNNNAERLIKKLQRETTELIELRKKVYKTHKINNAQTKDHSNLLGAFQFATIGFNEFLDAILPLVENDSNNTNKLSEAEQKEVLNTIQVDFIEFFRDAKLTKDEQINFIENQINGMYISFPETPRTDFFIERLKRLKEAIAKPQQDNKTDAPPQKEYNSSQFNEHTYKLFCYIIDEYKKDGIIKFINIWYYLKRNIDKTKYKNILFNFTQKTYIEFVKSYDIEIKKFEKAPYKYDEVELPILENITDTYYKSLKQNENT